MNYYSISTFIASPPSFPPFSLSPSQLQYTDSLLLPRIYQAFPPLSNFAVTVPSASSTLLLPVCGLTPLYLPQVFTNFNLSLVYTGVGKLQHTGQIWTRAVFAQSTR